MQNLKKKKREKLKYIRSRKKGAGEGERERDGGCQVENEEIQIVKQRERESERARTKRVKSICLCESIYRSIYRTFPSIDFGAFAKIHIYIYVSRFDFGPGLLSFRIASLLLLLLIYICFFYYYYFFFSVPYIGKPMAVDDNDLSIAICCLNLKQT